ncbi:ArsA family ATPase [Paramicrobacterium agarici]|uniref:Arsenite efflux ATP-binding protein ArsA n=1 Tax=Paramicrobacterium agarici TaxID=630514 RepID=A0A2A9DTG2_9MICO|nr:ArsA family ATPase [Microbacterium agarici]PFG30077.1 arsenite efflux ATP-binding protein ArsA [Microbacterium agarici]
MLLDLARSRRILFVGGKGGVGKTSVSSALALARARDGGRVLLVSTDPAHNLGHAWDRELSDESTRVFSAGQGHVDAVEIDPAATIDRHFATVAATMMRLLPERLHDSAHQHLDQAKMAPGSHESAVLERIAELVESSRGTYDLVIFDTAPSGHTLRLLSLPEKLTSWTETLLASRDRSERFAAAARSVVGTKDDEPTADAELRRTLIARRDRFALLRSLVTDADAAAFLVVSIAERLPVAESIDVVAQLTTLGIDPAAVVVNRRSPADAGELLAERRAREDEHLARLHAAIGSIPVTQVPLLAGDLAGTDALAELADQLAPVPG